MATMEHLVPAQPNLSCSSSSSSSSSSDSELSEATENRLLEEPEVTKAGAEAPRKKVSDALVQSDASTNDEVAKARKEMEKLVVDHQKPSENGVPTKGKGNARRKHKPRSLSHGKDKKKKKSPRRSKSAGHEEVPSHAKGKRGKTPPFSGSGRTTPVEMPGTPVPMDQDRAATPGGEEDVPRPDSPDVVMLKSVPSQAASGVSSEGWLKGFIEATVLKHTAHAYACTKRRAEEHLAILLGAVKDNRSSMGDALTALERQMEFRFGQANKLGENIITVTKNAKNQTSRVLKKADNFGQFSGNVHGGHRGGGHRGTGHSGNGHGGVADHGNVYTRGSTYDPDSAYGQGFNRGYGPDDDEAYGQSYNQGYDQGHSFGRKKRRRN